MSQRLLSGTFRILKRFHHHALPFSSKFNRQKFRQCFCKTRGFQASNFSSENLDDVPAASEEDHDLEWNVRTVLQYDPSDPVVESLLGCSTVDSVFRLLQEKIKDLDKSHLVQAILVLWHLQNVFLKVQSQMGNLTDTTEAQYTTKLKSEKPFQDLLKSVEEHCKEFSIDELTCSLLYLSKMDVPLRSGAMQALLNEIEANFRSNPESASLPALSRTAVAFKYNTDLWCQFYLLNLVPFIEEKMKNIATADDLRLLTICLLHCHSLVSPDVLKKYQVICEHLAKNSVLTGNDGKTMVKVLNFLSLTFWVNENSHLIRLLAKILQGHISKLDMKDVIAVNKTFKAQQEPAQLAEEVLTVAKSYLDSRDLLPDKEINIGILATLTQFSSYTEKRSLEKMLYKELSSDYFFNNMLNLFQILRGLKTSDHKLCNLFWKKTIESLRQSSVDREPVKLLRVAHRYMYFNNNLGGTYRYYGFENQMIAWILDELDHGVSRFIPSRLARGASFIVAYCKDPHIVAKVLGQLLTVRDQLSKVDCVTLSRGVEILLEMSKKKHVHPDVMQKLVEVDTCMNESAWRHLREPNLSITDINALLRTFHNRRASPDSLLFYNIAERLENCDDQINSRVIRDLSYSTTGLNFLLPRLLDRMSDYVVAHEEEMLLETAERVISAAYSLGYHPTAGKDFYEACSRLLIRDKDRLSCLSILQTCLALSFFHAFPPELVNDVFTVTFLERIDEELSTCYSKATYPVKVRYTLMELNRSVCLDQPELDVPWFHSKYCQEISSLDPGISTGFHEQVRKHLEEILGGEAFVQTSVYSPYGYKINFLVHLDAMTRPLPRGKLENTKDKIAVILHSDAQYTIGTRKLKGHQQIRQRHLEMLSYRVVPIPQHVWNAMNLTEPHAKKMFLSDQIWPDR